MVEQCPHCNLMSDFDSQVCPACKQNIKSGSLHPSAIHDRVFALEDEIKEYQRVLALVGKEKYCTGCYATRAIEAARNLIQIARKKGER